MPETEATSETRFVLSVRHCTKYLGYTFSQSREESIKVGTIIISMLRRRKPMLRKLKELLQNHPVHQRQTLDSDNLDIANCPLPAPEEWRVCLSGAYQITSLTAVCLWPKLPSFPKLPFLWSVKPKTYIPVLIQNSGYIWSYHWEKLGDKYTTTLCTNFATPLKLLKWFQSRKFKHFCRDVLLGIFLSVGLCVLPIRGAR